MSALKRVGAAIEGLGPWAMACFDNGSDASAGDLRAVLRLAKSAAELRRRVRLARRALSDHTGTASDHWGDDAYGQTCNECDAVALLDLRKPLTPAKSASGGATSSRQGRRQR